MGKEVFCLTGHVFKPWEENTTVCDVCKELKTKAVSEKDLAKINLQKEIDSLRAAIDSKQKQVGDLLEAVDAEPDKKGKKEKKEKKNKKGAPCIETQPVQGCRDFAPEDYRLRDWLFQNFRKVAKQFAFEEYDAPVLESENLYIVKAGKGDAKAGEEILDQMFNFTTKGGHNVALRPEMTPTLARLIMQKGQSLLLPVKWFSIPQCWRHEAIVRGRRREHYQWNMDIFGVPTVAAEAELLAAVITFLKNIGLSSGDVGIKINSRKLLQTVLQQAGVKPEQFQPVCIIIDKVDKLERCEIVEMLAEKGIDEGVIDTILKSLEIKTLEGIKQAVGDAGGVVEELESLFKYLDSYGFSSWVQLDASVVRGLAYYTGVVFECFDRAGHLRAICGGGRYDSLMDTFGSPQSIPACGFGFGDCVIIELLKDKKLLPTFESTVQDIVIPFNESMREAAVSVATKLRSMNRSVDIIIEKKRSPKQAFSYADRRGARRAILVAPDEWKREMVRVKDLADPEDTRGVEVPLADLK
eukprot:TRINITY_DN38134_c0_g1_i1.p1 TRINITY_DN38134_c0_g1~~TRINITY_DN38134_c0_g1_i1.p1  ORF type:complete len:542 (+),score=96.56 TRINITY_DN38134_c0_g1_i1:54-1628(+)